MKEPYGDEKCKICHGPLEKQRWGDWGDLIEWRITCSNLACKLEPYNTTTLKEVKDAT